MKFLSIASLFIVLACLPAAAAPYPERVQKLYMEGCRKGAIDHYRRANRPPDNPAILRACRCTLDQFERAMSIEEFSVALAASETRERGETPEAQAQAALTRLETTKQKAVETCSRP
jgi:hypothetical protein